MGQYMRDTLRIIFNVVGDEFLQMMMFTKESGMEIRQTDMVLIIMEMDQFIKGNGLMIIRKERALRNG